MYVLYSTGLVTFKDNIKKCRIFRSFWKRTYFSPKILVYNKTSRVYAIKLQRYGDLKIIV